MKIHECGPKINEKDVSIAECELGILLPDAYRAFLLSTNGGSPAPDIIDIGGYEKSPVDIQVFFGINRKVISSNLAWNFRRVEEIFGNKDFFPIACDSGGGIFCLRYRGNKFFDVVYLEKVAKNQDIRVVSPDFPTFLSKIRDWS